MLCFRIIVFAHLFACLWHFVGDISLKDGVDNWISDKGKIILVCLYLLKPIIAYCKKKWAKIGI